MSFFSVVIPLYNKENFIVETINSVLQQTFSDYEIIIVNDGSTDHSESKVLEIKDSRIHYFSKKNEGVSSGRNFGIEKATSNYICFLDADDYWYPDFLTEFYKTIIDNPDQKAFSCAIELGIKNKIYPAKYSINNTEKIQVVNYFEASNKQSIISSSSSIFHKSVFEKIGDFDLNIASGQDVDLWIRIGLNYPIVFINTVLARYTFDSNSLSRRKKDFSKSLNFDKFLNEEKQNLRLKHFLDLNRYSLALKAKLQNDSFYFQKYTSELNKENLNVKKRVLLLTPVFILKFLLKIQFSLVKIGLLKSVFK